MRRTFLLGSAAALLAACTPNAPYPTPFVRDEAKVVASADHWQQMAKTVAGQLGPVTDRPIDVQAERETQFGRAFHGLMVSALLETGKRVSMQRGADRLFYEAQRVRHPSRNMHLTAVEQVATGLWVRHPHGRPILPNGVSELILTVKVMRGDEIISSISEVFYVAGGDEWLYELPPVVVAPPPFPVIYR